MCRPVVFKIISFICFKQVEMTYFFLMGVVIGVTFNLTNPADEFINVM